MNDIKTKDKKSLNYSRYRVLAEFSSLMDKPVAFLAIIWLILIIIDVTTGLSPYLLFLSYIIWGIFILDFIIGLIIAPSRTLYLKKNWIIAITVMLPAFGMLRFFRAFRAIRVLRMSQFVRSFNLLRLAASARGSIRSVKRVLRTNALGSVMAATVILIFVGAAGLAYFEKPGIPSYSEALWWTAMIVTTIGTDYWPKTPEGRIITFILAVYAFSFFGYIAANLASYFIKPNRFR